MLMSPGKTQGTQPDRTWFATTHWSVVLAAKDCQDAAGRQALETLCRTYWYPLYAYVRKRGYGRQDAEDLTQEFFSHLLAKDGLGRVTQGKGKFRSFLLTSLNHFLVDQWKWASAQKRGAQQTLRMDWDLAETRFQQEPADATTAEMLFEVNWALALLDRVFEQLEKEQQALGKGAAFEHLRFCLTGERSAVPYADLAAKLQVSEANVKVLVHRLRQRYRELLRAEVANTVATPEDVEEEIRALFAVLTGKK